MAHFNLKRIVAAIIMAAAFFGCEPLEQPTERNEFNGNQAVGAKVAGDKLIGKTYRDARERFVDGGVEYSFIQVDVYEKNGEQPRSERTVFVKELNHAGVDPQYFHFSDVVFTTVFGNDSVLESVNSEADNWKVSMNFKKQNFKAENASKDSFTHSTTTGAATVTYTLPDEGEIKGYTVEFPAPSWTLTEKTLDNEDVTGVSYDGKSWDAVKYESQITATFEIAQAYRMNGEDAKKDVTVSNLAFFLKHVVDTKLENLNYVGDFYDEGNKLDTREEKVTGSLITRDNGEIVKTENFDLAMLLNLSLSQPEDIQVSSEEELKDTSFSHSKGEVSETPNTSNVFNGKKFNGQDSINLSDRTVSAPFSWSNWAWGAEVLPYAEITNREVKVKAEKNNELSTATVEAYTVTVTMTVTVGFVGINRKAETYEVSVKYNRFYNLPDDYTTEYEQADYVLELQSETDSKVSARDQHNTIKTIVKNRGEVVSTSEAKYPLGLYAAIAGGDTVKVNAPFKPVVTSIEDHPNTGDWKDKADAQGFDVRWLKDSQTIRVKGGNAINYEWYYEVQGQNKKDVYDHAEVKGISASDVTFSEPVLVDSICTDKVIKKVYRIDAKFTPEVTSTKAQTKASSNVNSFAVSTPIYQVVEEEVKGDEFVSDRIEKTVTKNGNSISYNVKLYETWSISGEKLKDEKSGTLTPSLNGSNGGAIVVSNVNFNTNGNGHTGTGTGTYTDNASNGENSFSNSYSWSAPASVNVQLNGTNGTKSETISTSWVITEAGQNIGSQTAVTGYYEYPYTNKVKGTYTVENESVDLYAEATKTLKVKRDIPKIIPEEWGKIVSAGFSAVPSHLVNGEYVDGSGAQTATSCMTIVTDKGAVPVLFGWADQDPRVPTTAQILAAPFTAGSYTSDYNSGYYNGTTWVPAAAADLGTGISYSIPGVPSIRFVRNESLVMWGWRGGNYSTVLAGYTCTVNDGTLTVTYNGQVVLEIR